MYIYIYTYIYTSNIYLQLALVQACHLSLSFARSLSLSLSQKHLQLALVQASHVLVLHPELLYADDVAVVAENLVDNLQIPGQIQLLKLALSPDFEVGCLSMQPPEQRTPDIKRRHPQRFASYLYLPLCVLFPPRPPQSVTPPPPLPRTHRAPETAQSPPSLSTSHELRMQASTSHQLRLTPPRPPA